MPCTYIGNVFASALWLLEVCSYNESKLQHAKFMCQCAESAHLFLIGRMAGQLCHHQIVLVYSLSLFTSSCFAPITSHVMSTKGHVTCQLACYYITHNHLAAIVSCIRRAPYIQKKISIILEKLVEYKIKGKQNSKNSSISWLKNQQNLSRKTNTAWNHFPVTEFCSKNMIMQ